MTVEEQEGFDLWQAYKRQYGPEVANALLSEFFAPKEYLAILDLVSKAMSEESASCVDTNSISTSQ